MLDLEEVVFLPEEYEWAARVFCMRREILFDSNGVTIEDEYDPSSGVSPL